MARKVLINDWLSEFERVDKLTVSQLQSYAISVCNYPDLINDLFDALHDTAFHEQYLEKICDQLFKFYRSKEDRLRLFTLMFIPTLIGIHLTNCYNVDKKLYRCVDVLLLSIYNLEIVDEEGEILNRKFRLPSMVRPSIFHEPSSVSSQNSALTEHALLRLESGGGDQTLSSFGPHVEYDVINCGNRMIIMTVLLKVYNHYLSSVPKQSYLALCKMAIKVMRYGSNNCNTKLENSANAENSNFTNYSKFISRKCAKIPLSSEFLVQLLNSVYFCMFNGVENEGFEALEEIYNRAFVNLYADVLMNSLRVNPSGQPRDGPMGISVALSPTSTTFSSATSGVSKAAITNASFRTKKLPDDIPIVTNSSSHPHLTSINEENEEVNEKEKIPKPSSATSTKQASSGGILPVNKIPMLQLLKERKDKKKEANTTAKIIKVRSENGDLIHRSFTETGDANAGVESDTSGISEPKSDYGSENEMIPLNTYTSKKAFNGEEQNSNCSSNTSSNAMVVPLLSSNSESRLSSTSIHQEMNVKLNDEIVCETYK
ncbi:hyccin-like isoform X2 [Dinothrombium tinctorium]|uniref:Hyccin-like isoform X2 n=1 Tax=Dinothrombium tinctorium TaxID=1965070 RepID=A0A3S3S2V3_9ACAR|nr:hyccin-like isoform X2 [Dinothrombium tinctorium]